MINIGIDVGVEAVKAVLFGNGKVIDSHIARTGLNRKKSSSAALSALLEQNGMTKEDVGIVAATGSGQKAVEAADAYVSDMAAAAEGALRFFADAKMVIDLGSEQARAIRLNEKGQVVEFVRNQKCASGVGTFIVSMARALNIPLAEIGPLSLTAKNTISMNSTCVVFAESEVVSLIHARTPAEDIARAIHNVVASRTAALAQRLGVENNVVFIGGVAMNTGVVKQLGDMLGVALLVPERPQMTPAIGAALIAASKGGQ